LSAALLLESRKAANYSAPQHQLLIATSIALIHSHYYKTIVNNYTGVFNFTDQIPVFYVLIIPTKLFIRRRFNHFSPDYQIPNFQIKSSPAFR
jgi:hypothetical protein